MSNRSGLKLVKSTVDTFFENQIKIYQPEIGYHYSMDPVILAAHVVPFQSCKIIDIGCGCGIIPVILGFRFKDVNIIGVEIQSGLAEFAIKNIVQNRLSDQIQILNKDIRTTTSSDTRGLADIIVSNPPYKKKNTGRLNPNIQKAVARHEIKLELSQFFSSANRLLKPRGQVIFIFPAERLPDLVLDMQPFDFQLNWIRFIHTKKNNNAKLLLVSALKEGHGNCLVKPPLYIYEAKNNPTKEYEAMFKP